MDLTPGRSLLLSRARRTTAPDHGWARFEDVVGAPAGDVVAVPRTYTAQGLSRDEWVRTRHAAAVRALEARGIPPAAAWWAAVALMGHWANETGWGRSEIDYALGNIRARSDWNGPVHYLQGYDDPDPAPYRAYTSLDEGVEDNVALATGSSREGLLATSSRYQPSFLRLLASDGRGPYVVSSDGRSVAFPLDVERWYEELTRAGWHPYSEGSMATFRGTVTRAAQVVGEPPSALATLARGAAGLLGAGAGAAAAWWLLKGRRK